MDLPPCTTRARASRSVSVTGRMIVDQTPLNTVHLPIIAKPSPRIPVALAAGPAFPHYHFLKITATAATIRAKPAR